ncbi:hypothetical protein L873DRAFT_1791623 [Choiromyces venosus 120613-1]|uniref:Uncharacterized protein n=1 Tax=Choiromyces venosus 120613-1 TaxID=1336337 RepID=A0A3N4JDX9_9PEZI|nr:hypothetical protein L873DRAFT_1791623 [Choiromyces venosus 120613-1]
MLFFLLSSAPERALGWPVFSFFFIFFFTTIVLGLLGSAIVVISRGVGDLLREVCSLFGVRSDPDSTSGGVARQHTRVRSGATPPVLRWWLDHGPYLANSPLESPDSGEFIKTCDGEEATVLPDPEELSGGYILDASPASERGMIQMPSHRHLRSTLLAGRSGVLGPPFPPIPLPLPPPLLFPPPSLLRPPFSPSLSPSSPALLPLPLPSFVPFRFPLPLPLPSSPSPSSPPSSPPSPSPSSHPSASPSPSSPSTSSASAAPTASSPSAAIESCEEFVSGYDSDAESSAFEEYPVGWEKWCVRPPIPPPPPSYAPYPDGLIY